MQRLALRRLSLLLVVLLVAAPSVPRLARAADAVEEVSEDEIDAFATEDEPVEEVDEKDVVVLTEKTFNDTVLKAKFALVRRIYPSSCGGDDDSPAQVILETVVRACRSSSTHRGADTARCVQI